MVRGRTKALQPTETKHTSIAPLFCRTTSSERHQTYRLNIAEMESSSSTSRSKRRKKRKLYHTEKPTQPRPVVERKSRQQKYAESNCLKAASPTRKRNGRQHSNNHERYTPWRSPGGRRNSRYVVGHPSPHKVAAAVGISAPPAISAAATRKVTTKYGRYNRCKRTKKCFFFVILQLNPSSPTHY